MNSNYTIALVEDDKDFLLVAAMDLERKGFRVHSFSEVREFVRAAPDLEMDLVICDTFTLDDPRTNPFPPLRNRDCPVPILLMSGRLEAGHPEASRYRDRAIRNGISHLWHKGTESYENVILGHKEAIVLVDLVTRLVRSKVGYALQQAIDQSIHPAVLAAGNVASVAGVAASPRGPTFPVLISVPCDRSRKGESWLEFRKRIESALAELRRVIIERTGVEPRLLVAANALACNLTVDDIDAVADRSEVAVVDLDARLAFATLEASAKCAGLRSPGSWCEDLDGSGVRIAVVDSGIDLEHPCLKGAVVESIDLTGEGVQVPGRHGTHVAGILGSRHPRWAGFVPGASLINIKAFESGTHQATISNLVQAFDEAIQRGAHVLNLSGGFSHVPDPGKPWIPSWHDPASGFYSALRKAVENSIEQNVVVVASAGNDHERAEVYRKSGKDAVVLTELVSPGLMDEVLTVGAATVADGKVGRASFSSYGVSRSGKPKPDLVAPGVEISSTIPASSNSSGVPISDEDMFGPMSGTSMATPMVTAAVAMLIQRRQRECRSWSPQEIRLELLQGMVQRIGLLEGIGAGLLYLGFTRSPNP